MSQDVSSTEQMARLGALLLPSHAVATGLLYLSGKLVSENKTIQATLNSLKEENMSLKARLKSLEANLDNLIDENMSQQVTMQDQDDEIRMLRLSLFLHKFGIPKMYGLLRSLNLADQFMCTRYCHCPACTQLTPGAMPGQEHTGCSLFPIFQKVCQARDLKLVVLTSNKESNWLDGSRFYDEDAHLVVTNEGAWESLGYGSKVAMAETFDSIDMHNLKLLFMDLETTLATRKTSSEANSANV